MSYEQSRIDSLLSSFNSIKRMNLRSARKMLMNELEEEFALPLTSGKLSWAYLHKRCEEANIERKWPKEGKTLIDLLYERKLRENKAKDFLEKKELVLFYYIENRNLKEVSSCITKKFPSDENDLSFSNVKSWERLLDLIKHYEPMPKQYRDMLYSVIMFKLLCKKRGQNTPETFFKRCSLCWRPVPIRFLGNNNNIFCQFHNYRTVKKIKIYKHGKAYDRGLAIQKVKNSKIKVHKSDPATFQENLNNVRNKLYSLMPISQSQFQEINDWLPIWNTSPIEALYTLPWKLPWPSLEKLFPEIPNICSAITNEILTSPTDLVSILCPIHPAVSADERESMLILNQMWKENYFLFVPELAYAEVWFSQCKISHGKIFFPA